MAEEDAACEVDSYRFSRWMIGGRNNKYGVGQAKPAKPKAKAPKKQAAGQVTDQCQPKMGGCPPQRPPGAISYAYSFTPYQYPHQPPPPPPYQQYGYGGGGGYGYGYYGQGYQEHGGQGYYQHGGHGYQQHGGQGYHGQFPTPQQGGYNYGMSHSYGGAHGMNMEQGGNGGAPVYGGHGGQHGHYNHGGGGGAQHVTNKQGLLPAAEGAGAAGAAANAHGGQLDTGKQHDQQSDCGGHMAVGGHGAAAAGAVAASGNHHGQGQLARQPSHGGAVGAAVAYAVGQHSAMNHAAGGGGEHMATATAAATAC